MSGKGTSRNTGRRFLTLALDLCLPSEPLKSLYMETQFLAAGYAFVNMHIWPLANIVKHTLVGNAY